jgi:hypothetical protein
MLILCGLHDEILYTSVGIAGRKEKKRQDDI